MRAHDAQTLDLHPERVRELGRRPQVRGLLLAWLQGTLLGLDGDSALRYGILLLMLTPVARVLLVTVGLAVERDWLFTVVCLFVLAVLASGIAVAVRR